MTSLSIFNDRTVSWAQRQPIADNSVRETMLGIAACAHNGGQCWPALADLARLTRQSEAVVRQNMRRLEADGYIRIEPQRGLPSLITLLRWRRR
jgi:hypothetical protein